MSNPDKVAIDQDDPEISMSLCAGAFKNLEPKSVADLNKLFEEYVVTAETFAAKPYEIMTDPNIVIRIENRYYDAHVGLAMIMSQISFKQPLSPE